MYFQLLLVPTCSLFALYTLLQFCKKKTCQTRIYTYMYKYTTRDYPNNSTGRCT